MQPIEVHRLRRRPLGQGQPRLCPDLAVFASHGAWDAEGSPALQPGLDRLHRMSEISPLTLSITPASKKVVAPLAEKKSPSSTVKASSTSGSKSKSDCQPARSITSSTRISTENSSPTSMFSTIDSRHTRGDWFFVPQRSQH